MSRTSWRGTPPRSASAEDEELRRLIIHGVLHLSGMDHETNDPDEPMLVRQENLLWILAEETIF